MDENQLRILAELGEKLPDEEGLQSEAMLASNIMAVPLARMRQGQASHEAIRAKARFSGKSKAYGRHLAREKLASQLVAEIDSEVARLKVEKPEAGEDRIAVYGYVRKDGKPVEGAKVSLVGKAGVSAYILTDQDGAYSLSVEETELQSLEVQIGKNIVMTDKQPIHKPTPVAFYRLIELEETRKPKPRQKIPPKQIADDRKDPPAKPEKEPDEPVKKPGPKLITELKKMTLHEGLGAMAKRELTLASISHVPGDDMVPRITGVKAAGDRKLALQVAVSDSDAGQLKTLSVLVSNAPKSRDAGMGSGAAVLKWLESKKLNSRAAAAKAARLNAAEFQKTFKIKTVAEARLIKRLLKNAVGIMKGAK